MPAEIKTRHHGASITDSDIVRFEEEIGCSLPADYRAFLLRTNGGKPVKLFTIDSANGSKLLLWYFHHLIASSEDERLRLEERSVFDSGRYLIFAMNRNRNPFLMALSDKNRGKIFYLNSDTAAKDQLMEKDLTLLADSFIDLLSKSYESIDHRVMRIIQNDLVEELDDLLADLPDDYVSDLGRSLIEEAAFSGSAKVVMSLAEKGYDLNEAISRGQMALPPEVMTALVRLRAQNKTGITAIKEHDLYESTPVQTPEYQVFKHVGVAIKLPVDFHTENGESFVSDQIPARIDVVVHETSLDECLLNYSETQWLYNQCVLAERMPVQINGMRGLYFVVVPIEGQFSMQFLLFEDKGKTIQLSASYPNDDLETKEVLKQSLLSAVTYNFDPDTLLGFSCDIEKTAFQRASVKPDMLFLSLDGQWPTQHPDQAVFMAIADKGIVLKKQHHDYAMAFFTQSAQRSEYDEAPVIDSVMDVLVDGLDAVIIMGHTNHAHLFSAVVFGHGRIYRFWGSCIPGKMVIYRSQFDHLVQSFRRKAEILAEENNHQEAMNRLLDRLTPMIQSRTTLSFIPDEHVTPASSHLFGKAVMPVTSAVPTIMHIQKPMGLLLQLLSTDLSYLPVSRLQIFANPSRFRDASDTSGDIQIVAGVDEKADQWQVVEDGWTESAMMLHQPVICRLAVTEGKSLPDWFAIQSDYPEIVDICEKGAPDTPQLLYQTALAILGIAPAQHMIGGDCPSEITPPVGSSGKPMKFAGKIASDAEFGLVWRHGGNLYLFYEEDDLSKWRCLIKGGMMM